jgi:hypothetical protein
MNITTDDDSSLDKALAGPLLEVPDRFATRVMAALPARPRRAEPRLKPSRAARVLQAIVLATCGAVGAMELMLFICGLWTATAVGAA